MGLSKPQLEFCSECCQEVDELNEFTGWCNPCSVRLGWIAPSCPNCGQPNKDGKQCSRCKYLQWLERNADEIERIMAVDMVTIRVAIRRVRVVNRPICHSCGNPIKGGTKGRHYFCKKHPECVKAHIAYSYHIRNKPHNEALQIAVTASVIYKLTANITNRNR